MRNTQRIALLLIVVTFCALSALWTAYILAIRFQTRGFPQGQSQHYVHYVTDLDPSFEALWSRSGIVLADISGHAIFAENNIFYFFGKMKSSDPDGIVALSASDPGVVIWHIPFTHFPTDFFVTLSGAYTATAGDPKITAYDLQTGEIKWTIVLRDPPTRGIAGLYESDGKVYIKATYNYILDSKTGELLAHSAMQSTSENTFSHIFFRARGIFSGEISYDWSPGSTSIVAIDNSKKDKELILWEVNNVASNPILFSNTVYYLTTDGKLVGVNADTGEFIHSLQFDSPSLGSIAVDPSTGIIYVCLEDNNQLFAFQIHQN